MSNKSDQPSPVQIPSASPAEMMAWITEHMGVRLPLKPICPCHNSPADYLHHALFGDRDAVVWANRGGGKTFLAAVASVAEQLMRPGTRTAVIGGSFVQSQRLIDSARAIIEHMGADDLIEKITASEIRFAGGGRLTAMTQSQKAVRGLHVPRICADEVELFDPGVWNALTFAPSAAGLGKGVFSPLRPVRPEGDGRKGGQEEGRTDSSIAHESSSSLRVLPSSSPLVLPSPRPLHGGPARMDYLSTAHIVGGRMSELVATAGDSAPRPRLFKWCIWDVIERCPPQRECSSCPLAPDCRGRARQADGFYPIEDAILTQARSSRRNWEAEMLCMGPRTDLAVFPEFDLSQNVIACPADGLLPMYRAMDFGFTGKYVCLWFQVEPGGAVRVVREYARHRVSLDMHAKHILAMDRELLPSGPRVKATYADPSGAAANVATGASIFDQLAAYGIICSCKQSFLTEGLEIVRSRLAPALGGTMLFIDPSCKGLVEAFQTYRWEGTGAGRSPAKDGPDHYIDALRYGLVNIWGTAVERRAY